MIRNGTLIFIAINVFFLMALWWFSPDGAVKIIQCDVGQGDSTLIVSGYTQILIDAGPDSSVLECLALYMPPWDRHLELVIATHADKDHIGGFVHLISRYGFERFVFNQLDAESETAQILKKRLQQTHTTVITAQKGQIVTVPIQKEDVRIEILWPEGECVFSDDNLIKKTETNYTQIKTQISSCEFDENQSSISGIVWVSGIKFLFIGDIDIASELAIIGASMPADVEIIKIAHHGSKSSTSESFVDYFKPEVAIIGVGKNNTFGHPSTRVIDVLRHRNINVFRTDLHGHIEIMPGEEGMIVRTQR